MDQVKEAQARIAARIEAMSKREAENRAKAPEFASFVERLRELFGEGVKVRGCAGRTAPSRASVDRKG